MDKTAEIMGLKGGDRVGDANLGKITSEVITETGSPWDYVEHFIFTPPRQS